MPLYDYKCPHCEHQFEAHHSMTADAPPCPVCGKMGMQRLITSAPSFARGMEAHAGNGHRATQEQLQDKWREETPKLRKKLEDKLGEDTVRRMGPSTLFANYD